LLDIHVSQISSFSNRIFSQQKIALENRNSKQTKLLTSEKFNDYFFLARFISYLNKVVSISVVKRQMVKPINCNTGKAKYLKNGCWVLLIYLVKWCLLKFFNAILKIDFFWSVSVLTKW
jgi:hypothetical protein